jgi:hypothetical protein
LCNVPRSPVRSHYAEGFSSGEGVVRIYLE